MLRNDLEMALTEQRAELASWGSRLVVPRDEEQLVRLDSDLAQVIIGVRRSGKSTLCHEVLRKSGVSFAYVNFDDERLAEVSGEDLSVILEILHKLYGSFECLFLDEVQNIPEWYLFVNRLLRLGKRLLVTGSNAKLLSGELATHLTGRYHKIELFPFSFGEFCAYRGVDTTTLTAWTAGERESAFDDYLRDGAFPALAKAGANDPAAYLDDLLNAIIERDIRQRYHVRHPIPLRNLAHHLLDVAPTVLNIAKIKNRLALSCAPNTVFTYIDYLKQAYLLHGVLRWSTKSHERLRSEKVYPVDVGLMNNRANAFAGANLGWRLETIVFLELLRRSRPKRDDVYYYQDARNEADFVICHGRETKAVVQVCYEPGPADSGVRRREVRGLLAAGRATQCSNLWLITRHERDVLTIEDKTIRICPICDWLLNLPTT